MFEILIALFGFAVALDCVGHWIWRALFGPEEHEEDPYQPDLGGEGYGRSQRN